MPLAAQAGLPLVSYMMTDGSYMMTDTNWGEIKKVWHREQGWVYLVSPDSGDWPIIEETGRERSTMPYKDKEKQKEANKRNKRRSVVLAVPSVFSPQTHVKQKEWEVLIERS